MITISKKNLFQNSRLMILVSFFTLLSNSLVFANNLSITNVTLEDRDQSAETAIVEFDINWDSSWRDATNHDAVWLILKVTKSSTVYHGMLEDSGVNPADTSPGSNKNLEVYVPTDKTGAFIRRKVTGTGTVTSTNVRLKLDYGYGSGDPDLNAAATDSLIVQVIGIEMVYIPTAAFRVGDTSSVSTLTRSTTAADSSPWYIESEALIRTNTGSYFYHSDNASGENVHGTTLTIPAAFPKGYSAFYCMKYEITEGLWVDFITALTAVQQTNRDITSSTNGGKNSDAVIDRNTICQNSAGGCTGIYGSSTISSDRPDRAVNYISWLDLTAFLDWVALRPMTELEFEKVARGPLSAVAGEYAWGSASITQAVTISMSPELGLETISTAGANASYCPGSCLTIPDYSRGDDFLDDGATGVYTQGLLRVGIFATGSTTRATAGAGYYGAMELSGNAVERVVTIGNPTGRNFSASSTTGHGNGLLVTLAGYEGNANVTNWPGTDTTNSARGVTGAVGSGQKGGNWVSTAAFLNISDRNLAATTSASRVSSFGGRGVRTYDGP